VLFDKLETAKMHRLDMSNVSSRVVSRRDEPNRIWAYIRLSSDYLQAHFCENSTALSFSVMLFGSLVDRYPDVNRLLNCPHNWNET